MNQLNSDAVPDDPAQLPPARRRRAHRLLAPFDADERAAFVDAVAHRASPTFDFFLFSLLAGAVFGVGLLLDSTPLLLLGAVLAPLMAPAVGISLGTTIGSARIFLRSLAGIAIGSLLVFGVGVLTGYAARAWLPLELEQAHFHAQLSWANFLVLALGITLASAAMVRSGQAAAVPSVAVAYELYLPLVIAGFGLSSQTPFLWPDGLVVFAVHLAWGSLLGALTLAVLGFRPLTLFGYTLGGVVTLLGVVLLCGLSSAGAAFGGNIALPTPIPTATPTQTLTPTLTLTPVPPTSTPTLTLTPTPVPPTATPTLTMTPSPTPVLALVDAGESGGAFLRAEPDYQAKSLGLLPNGTLVQLLPEAPVEADGTSWMHVTAPDGQTGWMVRFVLTIATPPPNW